MCNVEFVVYSFFRQLVQNMIKEIDEGKINNNTPQRRQLDKRRHPAVSDTKTLIIPHSSPSSHSLPPHHSSHPLIPFFIPSLFLGDRLAEHDTYQMQARLRKRPRQQAVDRRVVLAFGHDSTNGLLQCCAAREREVGSGSINPAAMPGQFSERCVRE